MANNIGQIETQKKITYNNHHLFVLANPSVDGDGGDGKWEYTQISNPGGTYATICAREGHEELYHASATVFKCINLKTNTTTTKARTYTGFYVAPLVYDKNGDMFYAAGGLVNDFGVNPIIRQNGVYSYNPTTNTWTKIGNMINARSHFRNTRLLEEKFYLLCGLMESSSGAQNKCEYYNIKTNAATSIADAPKASYGQCSPYGKEKICLFSGVDVYLYNGLTNTWTQAASALPNTHSNDSFAIATYGDCVYLAGSGYPGETYVSVYNTKTNQARTGAELLEKAYAPCACNYDNTLYYMGQGPSKIMKNNLSKIVEVPGRYLLGDFPVGTEMMLDSRVNDHPANEKVILNQSERLIVENTTGTVNGYLKPGEGEMAL